MSTEQQVRPRMSALRMAVLRKLSSDLYPSVLVEQKKEIRAGTHRFDIYAGQAVFARPRGSFVNRVEDRMMRLHRNALFMSRAERQYAQVTDDDIIIRERKMSKRNLKLVKSDGR